MDTIPMFSEELIEMLDRMYPPACIGPEETLRQADRRAGARELVDMLVAKLEYTRQLVKEKSINVHGQ